MVKPPMQKFSKYRIREFPETVELYTPQKLVVIRDGLVAFDVGDRLGIVFLTCCKNDLSIARFVFRVGHIMREQVGWERGTRQIL